MINLNDCIELGYLTRPHGIKGQLVLKLNNLSFDEIEEMELMFILIDGLPIPFFIEEFSERSSGSLLIKLEDITSEEQARHIAGNRVYIDKNMVSATGFSDFSLSTRTDFKVIDKVRGVIGTLDTVIDNAQNPLLRIINKKREIFLPLQEEFIVKIDETRKEIVVNCPSGLLDIYL